MLAIVPRLAAALNCSTLLADSHQPDGEDSATYYTAPVTNHYARIVHAASVDRRVTRSPTTTWPRPGERISPARYPAVAPPSWPSPSAPCTRERLRGQDAFLARGWR